MRAWGIFACLLVASCAGAGSERVVRPERQYVPSDVAAQASDPTHETIGGKERGHDHEGRRGPDARGDPDDDTAAAAPSALTRFAFRQQALHEGRDATG
jgi:hypothetical protein